MKTKLQYVSTIAVILVAMSLAASSALQHPYAFAQNDGQGMEMVVVSQEGSNTILVTGTMKQTLPTDVVFTIRSPDGLKIVDVAQVTPNDGQFMTEFVINSNWNDDGFYTITASGGVNADTSLYRVELPVEVIGGLSSGTVVTESNLENLIVDVESTPVRQPWITLDAVGDIGSDTIVVHGVTDNMSHDVTLTVTAPNGNVVTVAQPSPNLDGYYEAIITVGGPLWNEDGMYTVTAKQSGDPNYTITADVEIKDGLVVPEFGVVAAMVLAIAVVSVIVVSARSRLCIVNTL